MWTHLHEDKTEKKQEPTNAPTSDWTKSMLLSYARENDIDVSDSMTKNEILEAIEA